MLPDHFVSESCRGERCSMCREPAMHKVGEEIAHDDPNPIRHNLTAYVCCWHFGLIVRTVCPGAGPCQVAVYGGPCVGPAGHEGPHLVR